MVVAAVVMDADSSMMMLTCEVCVETDTIFPAEKRHRSEEVLKKVGVPYQFNLYSGVEHGFAVRADLSTKVAKYAKEAAFLQAVQWFDTHLKQ